MCRSITATLYRVRLDDSEHELTVTVAYLVPDESYAEIQSVEGADGLPVETTPEEGERMAAECLKDAKEGWRSAREP